MNRTILFSALGGTDPISEANLYDGSMLHICRVYKPDKVILYMSGEILQIHNRDNRYIYCLEKLKEKQQRDFTWEIIERDDLFSVENFDYFYNDFESIISTIYSDMDETDTLLLNISSGTPAMKSGLLVLQTIREYNCKLIQVITPNRKMNEHIHKCYDVKEYWDCNEENNSYEYENRCREVSCPSLSSIKSEEIIKKHISAYDYHAALVVAESLPASVSQRYTELVRMASKRILLDSVGADKALASSGSNFMFPIRSGNGRQLFEYALSVDIRLRRKEYSDFLRAITPLIVNLFENIIKKQFGIRIDDYLYSNNDTRLWDKNRLLGSELEGALNVKYGGKFDYGVVKSDHLLAIIQHYKNSTDDLYKIAYDVRNVEIKIRNLAAHEIVLITDDYILKETGYRSKKIMELIRRLFTYTDIRVDAAAWDSYDDMNIIIINSINGTSQKITNG